MNLIGYIEGMEIIFTFYPPDKFEATIPKKLNGKYAVELHAIDDAGNVTNQVSLYVLIDFQQLSYNILKRSFKTLEEASDYSNSELKRKFEEQNSENKYDYILIDNEYNYRELVSV